MRSSPGPMTLMVVDESVETDVILLALFAALTPISSTIRPESSEEKSDSICDISVVKSVTNRKQRLQLYGQRYQIHVWQNKGHLMILQLFLVCWLVKTWCKTCLNWELILFWLFTFIARLLAVTFMLMQSFWKTWTKCGAGLLFQVAGGWSKKKMKRLRKSPNLIYYFDCSCSRHHSPAVAGEEALDWFLLEPGEQMVQFSRSFHSAWCFSSMCRSK